MMVVIDIRWQSKCLVGVGKGGSKVGLWMAMETADETFFGEHTPTCGSLNIGCLDYELRAHVMGIRGTTNSYNNKNG
jgi:hypothetical protein